MTKEAQMVAGGVVLVGLLLWWFSKKGNAASVGAALGNAAVDFATGTAVAVYDSTLGQYFDQPINHAIAKVGEVANNVVGGSVGGAIYDMTHSASVPVPAYQLPSNFGILDPKAGW
jgi:hypothetical protein